jgi:orotidine-5'-phosphate decarboxylase
MRARAFSLTRRPPCHTLLAPAMSHPLSAKNIPPRERLIFPLDVDSREEVKQLVDTLGDAVWFYKLGLQLFMSGNYWELVSHLVDAGKKVFVDLKFFDVPETVASAVRRMRDCGADFATIHGNDAVVEAACSVERERLKLLAVTVLTSFDAADLRELGFPDGVSVEQLVLSRARRALAHGCDGVISSGLEARALRDELGEHFLVVSPGIRPFENRRVPDDQKRIVTPEQAFRAGADYIVVGRPIRNAPDPRAAAAAIQATIAELFGG